MPPKARPPAVPKRRQSRRKTVANEATALKETLKKERGKLFSIGDDECLLRYQLSEAMAIGDNLNWGIKNKERELRVLNERTSQHQAAMRGGETSESLLQFRLEVFQDQFTKQKDTANERIVSLQKQLSTTRKIIRVQDRTNALVRRKLKSTTDDDVPLCNVIIENDPDTPITCVNDVVFKHNKFITKSNVINKQSVWTLTEFLRELTDPVGDKLWCTSITRHLLSDCRLLSQKHGQYQPWAVTVPIFLFSYEFNSDYLWVYSSGVDTQQTSSVLTPSNGRFNTYKVVSDIVSLEQQRENDCVELSYKSEKFILRHSKWDVEVYNGLAVGSQLIRYVRNKFATKGKDFYTQLLQDPVLWISESLTERLVLPPPLLEYIYSRQPSECLGFTDAPEGGRWTANPVSHIGINWIIDLCDKCVNPSRSDDSIYEKAKTVLQSTEVDRISISFDKIKGLNSPHTISIRTSLESFTDVGRGDIIQLRVPHEITRASHEFEVHVSTIDMYGTLEEQVRYAYESLKENYSKKKQPSLMFVSFTKPTVGISFKIFRERITKELRLLTNDDNLCTHFIGPCSTSQTSALYPGSNTDPISISLFGIYDRGMTAGTSIVVSSDPTLCNDRTVNISRTNIVRQCLSEAADNSGWDNGALAPSCAFIRLGWSQDHCEIFSHVKDKFNIQQQNCIITVQENSNEVQCTLLWLSSPLQVASCLLSPFSVVNVSSNNSGFVTSSAPGYINCINGRSAAEECNRWCSGSLSHLITEAKTVNKTISLRDGSYIGSPRMVQLKQLFLEVEIVSRPGKKTVIQPLAVTPNGSLKIIEDVVEGEISLSGLSDVGNIVGTALDTCTSIRRSDILAVIVVLPSFQDMAKKIIVTECAKQLPSAACMCAIDSCHTSSYEFCSALTTSSLPMLILFGAPPSTQKTESSVMSVLFEFESSMSCERSVIAKATLSITPLVLVQALSSKRYNIPITMEKVSYSELPKNPSMNVLVDSHVSEGLRCSSNVDIRILQSVFNTIVRDSAPCTGCVTPIVIRDALSLQCLDWQPDSKKYLLALSGDTKVVVVLSNSVPLHHYDTVSVETSDYVCSRCGLDSLDAMPEGYTLDPMRCSSCTMDSLIVKLHRFSCKSPYQLSNIVTDIASMRSGDSSFSYPVEVTDSIYNSSRTIDLYDIEKSIKYSGVWTVKGEKESLGVSVRPFLNDFLQKDLSPFISMLNSSLQRLSQTSCNVTATSTHVNRLVTSQDVPSYSTGDIFKWSSFSCASPYYATNEFTPLPSKTTLFNILTNSNRVISQWSRYGRRLQALFQLDALFKVTSSGDIFEVEEISQEDAITLMKKKELLQMDDIQVDSFLELLPS